MDWLLNLPESLEERFWAEMETWEREQKMPYVTSWERIGERRGQEVGERIGEQRGERRALQNVILENLTFDHGEVPADLAEAVWAINDPERLRVLQRASVRAESLEAFRKQLGA